MNLHATMDKVGRAVSKERVKEEDETVIQIDINDDHFVPLEEMKEVQVPATPLVRRYKKRITTFLKGHYRMPSNEDVSKVVELANSTPKYSEEDIKQDIAKKDFLIRLAKSMHTYGSPVYRTEYSMTFATASLGMEGMFCLFPTLLLASFGESDRNPAKSATHILRIDQGLNCEKLARVDDLADKVICREIELDEANNDLNKIIQSPGRFNRFIKVMAYMLCSACIAPLFFSGSILDFFASGILGLIVGLISLGAEQSPTLSKLFEPLAALVASFSARVLQYILPSTCYFTIVLSAVIWLLPGLSITIAVMELSTRNMVSGTSRFFYAFLILLELGFGIAIGTRLVVWDKLDVGLVSSACTESPISVHWYPLLYVGVIIPFVILMDAHPKQWPSMVVSSLIGYLISYFGSWYFGPDTVSFMASFMIGIFGTMYNRFTKRPAMVPILPGIIMLVPGSIGVRGVSSVLVNNDVISGIAFSFEMMTISLSITVGLLFAHLVVYPKKVLTPVLL